ncbi:hypothetical protein ABXN37_09610 [Piscinibacter sakaiensis]|uniref:hypothetical protein n=1 Tax=Piscinibacter sakaiensis TaxID=1547922 RepID=UPI003729A758
MLAIGNLASNSFAALRGQAGYADTPYPSLGLLAGIDRGAPIGILGTSLSAVDAIAGLVAQGQRGPIHAVSRNGRLPSVRGLLNPATALRPIFRATLQQARDEGRRLGLDTLAALLADELRALPGGLDEDLQRLATELPDALDFLEAEIALARSRPRAWQSIGNALNECVDLAWQVLDEPGRRRFDRDWRAVWMARRVSFPLENALLLRELLREGRLQVHRGFAGVTALPRDGFELRLQPHGGGAERRLQVQGLVNATSFSTDAGAALAEQPLLRSLIDAGLAVPDPDGGLRLDADTGALLRRDGEVEPTVTVLGSLAAGTYFWTNAMEVNARLAMGQARRAVAALAALPGEVETIVARH